MKKPRMTITDEVVPWPPAGGDPVELQPFVTIHKSSAVGKTEELCRGLGLATFRAGRFVAVSTPYMTPQADD